MNPLCSTCKTELPTDHHGPCPRCGGTAKTFRLAVSDTVTVSATLDIEHVHEYYQKNHRALGLGIAVAVGSSIVGVYFSGLVGLLIGLIIGLAALWLIPSIRTKVIQKKGSHYE